jgi:hypothetical protein
MVRGVALAGRAARKMATMTESFMMQLLLLGICRCFES